MLPMRKLPRIAYFWPGLPQLWLRGSWAGLVIAVGFTTLANVLILATCVFHDWIPREQMLGGYGLVAVSWLAGWWQYRRQRVDEVVDPSEDEESIVETSTVGLASEPREQLFREAQQVYLRGDWVAAEQKLLKLLKLDDRDAEARLMLATLWRHQGRHREATRQLDKLNRLEAADPWQYEIVVEREENVAALAESGSTTEHSISEKHIDDATSVDTTQESEEPETHSIAAAQPPAAENQDTNRRWAA
jgi:tetratricopeptide (TPR) repeat protein